MSDTQTEATRALADADAVMIEAKRQIEHATRVLAYIKTHYPAVFEQALERAGR